MSTQTREGALAIALRDGNIIWSGRTSISIGSGVVPKYLLPGQDPQWPPPGLRSEEAWAGTLDTDLDLTGCQITCTYGDRVLRGEVWDKNSWSGHATRKAKLAFNSLKYKAMHSQTFDMEVQRDDVVHVLLYVEELERKLKGQ